MHRKQWMDAPPAVERTCQSGGVTNHQNREGQRAAVVMSLVQSAKLSSHDPWTCLKDVLECLLTQLSSRLDELLPHNWRLTS